MKNIIKDIRRNCPDCSNTEKVVEFLYRRNDLKQTADIHREIAFFYQDAIPLFKGNKANAKRHTMEMMGVSERTFYNAIKKLKS